MAEKYLLLLIGALIVFVLFSIINLMRYNRLNRENNDLKKILASHMDGIAQLREENKALKKELDSYKGRKDNEKE